MMMNCIRAGEDRTAALNLEDPAQARATPSLPAETDTEQEDKDDKFFLEVLYGMNADALRAEAEEEEARAKRPDAAVHDGGKSASSKESSAHARGNKLAAPEVSTNKSHKIANDYSELHLQDTNQAAASGKPSANNASASSTKKAGIGRHGNPKMHLAVAIRQCYPTKTLLDALLEAGFIFPDLGKPGVTDATCRDAERGVSLTQHKNQLMRRLRLNKEAAKVATQDLEG